MKRNVLFSLYALVVLILVAATACGGGEPTQPAVQPTSVPPPTAEPTRAPATGGALDITLAPTFGEQTLTSGFVPDPLEVALISGGSVDATSLGGGCNGYAASAPDFRLRWDGASARLRIMFVAATAGQDTTLIINAADGSWYCNDDAGGLNPMVEFTNPVAGQYDIWVGSYSAGEYVSGTLAITELDLNPNTDVSSAPATGGALDITLVPTFGEQALTSGFLPDPFEVALISGGTVDATYLGNGCAGYAASAPDFRLRWDGTSARLRVLFVAATAGQDTTLIINAADGSWHCNDDAGGLNPMVEFANPVAGQYDIWVGSYSSGEYVSGTLRITELDLVP